MRRNGALNLVDGDIELAQKSVESASGSITGSRANIGTYMRFTLGAGVGILRAELESTIATKSQIEDADIAEEVMNLARAEIMQTSAITVLKIASDNAERMMDLFQGPAR